MLRRAAITGHSRRGPREECAVVDHAAPFSPLENSSGQVVTVNPRHSAGGAAGRGSLGRRVGPWWRGAIVLGEQARDRRRDGFARRYRSSKGTGPPRALQLDLVHVTRPARVWLARLRRPHATKDPPASLATREVEFEGYGAACSDGVPA